MIQVINGEITQYSLPRTGTLSTGETVSGYNLLDEETLQEEGWLPLENNPLFFNEETQYLVSDGYEILEDKVIKKYKIEDMPEPGEMEPSEIELLNERVNTQDNVIEEILFDIIPEMLGGNGGE
mgnify:CR=1 FL=1